MADWPIRLQDGARPLCFDTVEQAAEWWRAPADLRLAESLQAVPIGASELLQLSHQAPIAFEMVEHGPSVVALTGRRFHNVAPFTADFRWRHAYVPLALRCLPLCWSAGGAEQTPKLLGIADFGDLQPHADAAKGKRRGRSLPIAKTLSVLAAGFGALESAAEALLVADLLSPLKFAAGNDRAAATDFHVLNIARFQRLTPRRIAALARSDGVAIDLAIACYFSYRLLPPRFLATHRHLQAAQQDALDSSPDDGEHDFAGLAWLDATIDMSDLFPVDGFIMESGAAHG